MLMSTMVDCLKRFSSSKSNDEGGGGGVDPAQFDVTKLLQSWIAQNKEKVKVGDCQHVCRARWLLLVIGTEAKHAIWCVRCDAGSERAGSPH